MIRLSTAIGNHLEYQPLSAVLEEESTTGNHLVYQPLSVVSSDEYTSTDRVAGAHKYFYRMC